MGLRDTEEMLEACKAQGVTDERTIAHLVAERDDLARTVADQARQLQEQAGVLFAAGEQHGILWRERHTLEQQIDQIRRLVTADDADGWDEAPGTVQDVLAIVGTQPTVSGDEHERSA